MPLSCPQCQTPLTAKREQQGEVVRCPVCETKLQLPISKRLRAKKKASAARPLMREPNLDDPVVNVLREPVGNSSHSNVAPRPPRRRLRNGFRKKHEIHGASRGLAVSMVALGLTGLIALMLVLIYRARSERRLVEPDTDTKPSFSQSADSPNEVRGNDTGSGKRASEEELIWE